MPVPQLLNLQLPVLVVDRRLLPDPALLGLEPFGSRNPRLPIPTTRIVVQHHPGAMISIWDHHPGDPTAQLLSWHRATPITRKPNTPPGRVQATHPLGRL